MTQRAPGSLETGVLGYSTQVMLIVHVRQSDGHALLLTVDGLVKTYLNGWTRTLLNPPTCKE
jgi:hypothetical protein